MIVTTDAVKTCQFSISEGRRTLVTLLGGGRLKGFRILESGKVVKQVMLKANRHPPYWGAAKNLTIFAEETDLLYLYRAAYRTVALSA